MTGEFGIQPCRVVAGPTNFAHRFGGDPVHDYDDSLDPELILHSLYIFDTSDPNLATIIPDVSFVPLYYGMFHLGCELVYEVVSDSEIVFHQIESDGYFEDGWTDWGWESDEIPAQSVCICPMTDGEQKILALAHQSKRYDFNDVFSPDDHALLKTWGYPFTQLFGPQRLPQGEPNGICKNEDCGSSNMSVFAVIWNYPVPDFCLWGNDFVQIVYEICRDCKCIHVCNCSG